MKRQLCTGLFVLGFCGYATAQEVLAPLPQALTDTADIATLSGLTNSPALAAATEPADLLQNLPSEDLEGVVGFLEILGAVPVGTIPGVVSALLETTPEDLNIIAGNLENVPEAAIYGKEFWSIHRHPETSETGLRDAAVELFKGNLVAPEFGRPLGPSATSSTLLSLAAASDALVADTSHDSDFISYAIDLSDPLPFGVDLSNTIIYSAWFINDGNHTPGSSILAVEKAAAPLFGDAEPLTLPVINILEDL